MDAITKERYVFSNLIRNYGYSEAHIIELIIPQYAEPIREALNLGYGVDAITNMVQEKIATKEAV